MAKNLVSGLILAHLAQIRTANFLLFFFFSKIWIRQSLYHGQPPSCAISEKTNDPILRNLVTDRWTDRWTDRPMRLIS